MAWSLKQIKKKAPLKIHNFYCFMSPHDKKKLLIALRVQNYFKKMSQKLNDCESPVYVIYLVFRRKVE